MIEQQLLNEADTAKYLGVSRSFLRVARMQGPSKPGMAGPPFVRLGGRMVRYDREDLDRWISEHKCGLGAFDVQSEA